MRKRFLLRNSQSLLSGSQARGRGLKAVNSGRKSKDRGTALQRAERSISRLES